MIKKYAWLIPVVVLAIVLALWAGSLNNENMSPNSTTPSQDSGIQLEEKTLSPPSLVAETDGQSDVSGEKTIAATASLVAMFQPDEATTETQPILANKAGRGPYCILGTVTSIALAPIDEATVTCRTLSALLDEKNQTFTVVTQNGGQFAFGFYKPGVFELTANMPGYALGSARVELSLPGPESVEIIMRPGDSIEGTVRENLTGILLPDVTIWARAKEALYSLDEMRPQRCLITKSKPDGSYTLDGLLPDLTYTVTVYDGDHAPEQRSGVKPGGLPVDFHLNRGGRISGRVVWESSGEPVEGALVSPGGDRRLVRQMTRFQSIAPPVYSATTQADGTFSLGGLPTLRRVPVTAIFEEEGDSEPVVYCSETLQLKLGADEHKTDVELVLARRPTQRVFGVVRDLDRHLVAGARVCLHYGRKRSPRVKRPSPWMVDISPPSLLDEGLTDTDGHYELILPFSETMRVEVEKEGYYARPEGSDTFRVDSRTMEYEIDFILFPGYALSGMVLGASSGKPVPKVEMCLQSEARGERNIWQSSRPLFDVETQSDGSGRYEFPSVAAGAYKLQVLEAPSGYALPEESFSVTIAEDEPAMFDVPLPEGVSISGTVLYPDGRYASGARIEGFVIKDERTPFLPALSDESDPVGRYSLSAFPVDSEVRLVVFPLKFPDLNPAPLVTEPMTIGESLDDYELKVPEAAIARVEVTSSEQKPLKGQTVNLSYILDDPLVKRVTQFSLSKIETTNGKGIARFTGLAPGQWKISIKTRKDTIEDSFYASEGETVEVSLVIPVASLVDNSGVLAGTVHFEDGSPGQRVQVWAKLQGDDEGISAGTHETDRTDSEGKFKIRGLRKGASFEVTVSTRRVSKAFSGITTTNRDLVFVLPNTGGLAAKVLDAGGDPPVESWTAYLFRIDEGTKRPVFSKPETEPAYGLVRWNELSAGTYQILVSGTEIPRGYSKPVSVQPDELTEGVEIRLPEPVHFSGEVVDANSGEGIAGVEVVEIVNPNTPGARMLSFVNQRRVYTDGSGDFLMGDLPKGSIHVRLVHPNYEKTDFELESIPSSETRIQMQPNSSE